MVKLTQEEATVLVEVFHQLCDNEVFGWAYGPMFEMLDLSDEYVGELHQKLKPFLEDGKGEVKLEIEQ